MTGLLYKLGATAIALLGLWWLWQHDRAAQYEAGRQTVITIAKAAGDAKAAENKATGQARDELAAAAEFRHVERLKEGEAKDAKDRARAADLQRTVQQLRASAGAARDRAPAVDAGATCGADHQQRDERSARLLEQGRELAVEAAELLAEANELVTTGRRGLDRGASLIELANEWGKAVKLGER